MGGEEEAETTSICYERLFAANLHFLLAFTYPVQCGMWDSSRNGVSEPEYKPIVYSSAQRSVLRIVRISGFVGDNAQLLFIRLFRIHSHVLCLLFCPGVQLLREFSFSFSHQQRLRITNGYGEPTLTCFSNVASTLALVYEPIRPCKRREGLGRRARTYPIAG